LRKVKIPWYSVGENLEILRKEALFSVRDYWIRILFSEKIPTGVFCRHDDLSWITVNPLPQYEREEGEGEKTKKVKKPYCGTRTGQWNLARAILRHELRHFRLTSKYSARNGSTLHWLLNALEDGRIEAWTDPLDSAAADLFRHAGNAMWRAGWKEFKTGASGMAKGGLFLNACLFWRWGVSRISHRHFCKALFGHDETLPPLWEKVKVEVEAAWRAPDTAAVQTHAERILDLIGVKGDAPHTSRNPLGELFGDGSQEPETPRAAGQGIPLPGEVDVPEAEMGDTDDLTGEEADLLDESLGDDSPTASPPTPDPEVDYDENSRMEPRGYASLVEEASPLAERMLRLSATRARRVAHPERGVYSLRREWQDADRPNDYLIPARGGKKRAICCVIDCSGSNAHRSDWIRLALMALHLAAIRDGHKLSILACGQESAPHYAVIQASGCLDVAAAKARIAGLRFPYGSEYMGAALEAGVAVLRKEKESLKELLLLSDGKLVVPGDTERAQACVRKLPPGIRVTGLLLVEDSARLSRRDDEFRRLMESLLQGSPLAVTTAQEMPEALNAILVH